MCVSFSLYSGAGLSFWGFGLELCISTGVGIAYVVYSISYNGNKACVGTCADAVESTHTSIFTWYAQVYEQKQLCLHKMVESCAFCRIRFRRLRREAVQVYRPES